jgi:hypothetical protein
MKMDPIQRGEKLQACVGGGMRPSNQRNQQQRHQEEMVQGVLTELESFCTPSL